ncbi:MAG: hypothetical protein ACRD0S_09690 [Acidimicrobiales bacterium]
MNFPGGAKGFAAAAAAVVALGGVVGFFLVGDDDDGEDTESAAQTTTTSLSTTSTSPTSTTVAGATSSTTAAPSTTSTTRATSTTASTTTTTGATTSTAPPIACGTGSASVSFVAKDLTTDFLGSSFVPQANVENRVDKPIQVETITLEVTYPGNDVRTVNFSTSGTVVPSGNTASFTAEKITTTQRYESVRFTRFTYFTEGQPTACRVSTP